MAGHMRLAGVNKPPRGQSLSWEKSSGCCRVSVKQKKSNLWSVRRSWTGCPLFVSERMLSRRKLTQVLSDCVRVLGDLVNSPARILWRAARGGPERLYLLRIILMKIPAGTPMDVLSARENNNIRMEVKNSWW